MSLRSLISESFWEEAPAPAAPEPQGRHAATGAPAFLRGAVRFAVVGVSAMVLTAQVAGIRLAAPVDADPSYCVVQSQQCKDACAAGPTFDDCIEACNVQRQQCRRDQA